nr:MAG TPA: hypothetical protein [Caudoviricetes sp.]
MMQSNVTDFGGDKGSIDFRTYVEELQKGVSTDEAYEKALLKDKENREKRYARYFG